MIEPAPPPAPESGLSHLRRRVRSLLRSRVRPWWRAYRWLVIGGMGLLAVVLIHVGLDGDVPWWHQKRIFRTLQILGLGRGDPSAASGAAAAGRWMLTFVALYTVGKAWAVLFREQLLFLRLRRLSGHAVVCGLGDKGWFLATALRERGVRVVVVEARGNAAIEQCRGEGIMALVGDATDPETLRTARVEVARYLIAVCGDDGTNAEIGVRARELGRDRRASVLGCLLHIGDLELYNVIRERELAADHPAGFRLQCFNVFASGARKLLEDHPIAAAREHAGGRAPHLLVIGLGRFGESLVLHAAQRWRLDHRDGDDRLRITVIDEVAASRAGALAARYPRLETLCEIRPFTMSTRSPEFERGAFLEESDTDGGVTAVYVCTRSETVGLSAALSLRARLAGRGIPIVVRVGRETGLAALLRPGRARSRDGDSLRLFGALPRTCNLDLLVHGTNDVLAQAIHANYVNNEERHGSSRDTNPSMASWDELPDSLKESNRLQADQIGVKLERVGCAIAPLTDWSAPFMEFTGSEVELLAKMEHERWMEERRRADWSYAAVKDNARKEHPDLVPWIELSEDARDKDREAVRAIPRYLAWVGFQIVRLRRPGTDTDPGLPVQV